MNLLQEANLDDKFNEQIGKIQKAISKLNEITATMTAPGSAVKPVKSQAFAVRVIADDLKGLADILDMSTRGKK